MPLFGRGKPNIEKMTQKRDVKGLCKALSHKDETVRRDAVRALCKIGDAAVESLITALKDKDETVRKRAVGALGEIGDARAVEPLIAALKDTNSSARENAAWALGKIGDKRAVEPLIAALKDVSIYAAKALGEIGDERAVKPLISLAMKHDWALSLLYRFDGPRVKEALARLPLICEECKRLMQRPRAGTIGTPKIQIGTPEALAAIPLECPNCHVVFCTSCAKHIPGKALGCPKCGCDLLDIATRTPVDYHGW